MVRVFKDGSKLSGIITEALLSKKLGLYSEKSWKILINKGIALAEELGYLRYKRQLTAMLDESKGWGLII